MNEVINKSMDFDDLPTDEARDVTDELNGLIRKLRAKNLKISSWYGAFDLSGNPESSERINRGYGYKGLNGAADDRNFPWFLYWEIVWVFLNTGFKPGQRVLDLGGYRCFHTTWLPEGLTL